MSKQTRQKTVLPATDESLRIQLVDAFSHFGPAFQRWADGKTQRDGLTAQRLRILVLLSERGPMIMRELTRLLGVTATNVTALIDALEADGYVERKPHPDDRRATLLAITPAAIASLTTGCLGYRQRVATLFETLSDPECEQLLGLMQKLGERLTEP